MLRQPQDPESQSAAEQYRTRRSRYSGEVTALERVSTRYSNLRLAAFLFALIVPLVAYNSGYLAGAAGALVLGGGLFVFLLIRHGVIIDQLEAARRLLLINERGIGRLSGEWKALKEQGIQFLDRSHPYAVDLDVFGPKSLFQWICTAHSPQGQEKLAGFLANRAALEEIPVRQKALAELAGKLDWRQQLEQSTMTMEGTQWGPLLHWAESPDVPWFHSGAGRWLRFLPVLTLLGGGMAYFAGAGAFPLTLLLSIQAVLALGMGRSLRPHIAALEKQQPSLGALESAVVLVEQEEFTAELNCRLRAAVSAQDQSAATEIGSLRATTGWLQMRNNPPVHFALSILSLWDLQWVVQAESWRQRNGGRVRGWLASLAEFEALGSLAVIPFENPEWPFPEISAQRSEPFDATELGHPLLPEKTRVTNSLRIEREGSVCLITGSNMSGKSTFLRTVGVNLVLAYAGAPVCAQSFRCAYLPLYTSMRVTDDLDAGVSSFYAELLRVKTIIEASRMQPVFWMIDEIFRGTNSRDRIGGAREVLKTLSALHATGLVSTHDLELSQLTKDAPELFRNYHFSEQYTDDGIGFDHRLKPGESQTTNAVYLMKHLGILPG
ncbi:MAG: DNA mismatch repair protein [Verrucomicrobiaceae bacterium]|nr:MAG: DNA mismatch repair protein [Verrucomicrobiaceae bacterium]